MTSPAAATRAIVLLFSAALFGQADAPPEPPRPPEGFEMPEPPEPTAREVSLKGIHVGAGETRHGDISAFAPSGSIEGVLDGDLYLWTQNLRISGTVEGDVFFAGSQLDITGTVKKSIRALSGQAVIDGEVEGNVFVVGGSVTLGSKSHIKGNVTCSGGQLVHNGVIDGTLKFTGGTISLNGKVLEDAEIAADSIQLDKGARIEGDVEYSARNRMDAEMQRVVGGDVSFDESPNVERRKKTEGVASVLPSKTRVFFKFAFFLASFLFGCALIALFGAYEPRIVDALRTDTLRCAGLGFVSFLVTIAVCLSAILILTLIFIPIYLILYVVAMYLAKIPVAMWLGRAILARLHRTSGPYLALLVGLVPLYVLFAIPVLGWLAYCAVILLGLGAMIATYMAQREAKKAAAAIPPEGPPAQAPIAS